LFPHGSFSDSFSDPFIVAAPCVSVASILVGGGLLGWTALTLIGA
jgi:hypothetical protein